MWVVSVFMVVLACLNESPSKKEGKYERPPPPGCFLHRASMKAPPKRKGNQVGYLSTRGSKPALDESPSEKAGKFSGLRTSLTLLIGLNESPPEKEGKSGVPAGHQPAS